MKFSKKIIIIVITFVTNSIIEKFLECRDEKKKIKESATSHVAQ